MPENLNNLGPRQSRWNKNITSKNDNYDFNMFSNYINNTFKNSSRTNPTYNDKPSPISKVRAYEYSHKPEISKYTYQVERPVATNPYTGRAPTMVESKYMRSSSTHKLHQNPISYSKVSANHLLTKQYNLPSTSTGAPVYRIAQENPTTGARIGGTHRFVEKRQYTPGTGQGLGHHVTAKVLGERTLYTGGNRGDLVQSMYREKPSSLLQMKYGNTDKTGTGMRY
jgi:hypothetical protein